jgi:hypothetical protein
VNAWELADYGKEVWNHVSEKRQVTVAESQYLYFLARILTDVGSADLAGQLDELISECTLLDSEPLHLGPTLSDVVTSSGVRVKRANWRFLPDPENLSAKSLLRILSEHFAQHVGHGIVFELERIEFALSLKPIQICIGLEEFVGYYAFLFLGEIVLFECPVYGNAAYIVRGDWRALSQEEKSELERKGDRVIHCHHWSSAIQGALERCRREN